MSQKIVYNLLICFYLVGICLARDGLWQCAVQGECAALAGSECTQGYCVCPLGMARNDDNTECVRILESPYLNSPCDETRNCRRLVTGFECHQTSKTCVCQEGFHYLAGRCWSTVAYGDSCISSYQCNYDLQPLSMECRDGICLCKDNFYQREIGQCRRRATSLGEHCILDEDCEIETTPNAICSLATMACVDPDALLETSSVLSYRNENASNQDSKSNNLITRALANEECFTDDDCAGLGPAYCSPGRICTCIHGYYPSSDFTSCLAELGIRNPVEGSCSGFEAFVEDNTCVCSAGFFYSMHTECRKPTRRFGESCTDDISCRTFGLAAHCVVTGVHNLTQCVCDEIISNTNVERQFCEPFVNLIGEPCEDDDNCPATSECVESFCACTNGTIPSPSLILCVPTDLELGDECVSTGQCNGTANTACTNNRCACAQGFLEDEGICYAGIGGACDDNADCIMSNSECAEHDVSDGSTEKLCRCVQGYVDDSHTCYRVVNEITGECEVNVQCYGLGDNTTVACIEGSCTCLPETHFRDDKCFDIRALGEFCSSTSQCFTRADIERTECRNSMCQCLPGYRSSYSPDSCNSSPAVYGFSWLLLMAGFYLVKYTV